MIIAQERYLLGWNGLNNLTNSNSTIGIGKVILQYKISGRYSASDADVLSEKLNGQACIEDDSYGGILVVSSRYRSASGIDGIVRKISEECGLYFEEYSV